MSGLTISFHADIESIQRELPRWANERIPSITRNALNDTVVEARKAELKKIEGVFDRPTPYIKRAPRYTRATKEHLVAEVYIPDDVAGGNSKARILGPQVHGGPRRLKPFEYRLRQMGILRPDEYTTIAIGYPRNAYGNLPGPRIVQILSQLQAFNDAGYSANETARSRKRAGKKRSRRYFVPSGYKQDKGISRLPRGIYERQGNRIRAVLIFVTGAPRYRKRYDFGQATIARAQRVFAPHWIKYFHKEAAKAAASAG